MSHRFKIFFLLIFLLKFVVGQLGIPKSSYYTIDQWRELSDGITPNQRQKDLFKIIPKNSIVPDHIDLPKDPSERLDPIKHLMDLPKIGRAHV